MAETRVAPTNADATTSDAVDAPSIYWKLCGVPIPTPLLLRDAYGFQWLHFGADLSDEGDIVEQLKADYTQIGTMAAVMIIFSTNMLLARNKLDVRSDLYGRNQIMGFYTLAWILADVSFLNCAFDCVVLKLALNTCPDDIAFHEVDEAVAAEALAFSRVGPLNGHVVLVDAGVVHPDAHAVAVQALPLYDGVDASQQNPELAVRGARRACRAATAPRPRRRRVVRAPRRGLLARRAGPGARAARRRRGGPLAVSPKGGGGGRCFCF